MLVGYRFVLKSILQNGSAFLFLCCLLMALIMTIFHLSINMTNEADQLRELSYHNRDIIHKIGHSLQTLDSIVARMAEKNETFVQLDNISETILVELKTIRKITKNMIVQDGEYLRKMINAKNEDTLHPLVRSSRQIENTTLPTALSPVNATIDAASSNNNPTNMIELPRYVSVVNGINQTDTVPVSANSSKGGEYVGYDHNFGMLHTKGRYFVYNTEKCDKFRRSLKYENGCGMTMLEPQFHRRLLIVAVQRSGTHYIWEMLNRLQIDVHHEGVGPDGAVGWMYAVNSAITAVGHGIETHTNTYIINNPERLTKHRFDIVMHQVRHPLRVIATLVSRCPSFDRYWIWIAKMKKFSQIKSTQSPLMRGMLLYYLWNKHIESYADIRFLTEVTSPRDVCVWAGFPLSKCSYQPTDVNKQIVEPPEYNTGTVTNSTTISNSTVPGAIGNATTSRKPIVYMDLTWEQLDQEDLRLSNKIKEMAISYGYDLDPNTAPQNAQTRAFTA